MKKLIILLIIVCGFTPALRAMGSPNQHLSPKEFRAKQQAFITEKAGLTQEEAAKFFPVKSFRARKFIWCKEPRCVSTANC